MHAQGFSLRHIHSSVKPVYGGHPLTSASNELVAIERWPEYTALAECRPKMLLRWEGGGGGGGLQQLTPKLLGAPRLFAMETWAGGLQVLKPLPPPMLETVAILVHSLYRFSPWQLPSCCDIISKHSKSFSAGCYFCHFLCCYAVSQSVSESVKSVKALLHC